MCGSGFDCELTVVGGALARAVAAAYASTPWSAVYTSPLRRTRETGEIVLAGRDLPLVLAPELREIAYGEWEGSSVEAVRRRDGERYARWAADPAWNPPPSGESAHDVARRALGFVASLAAAPSDGGPLLLVSHKATIRILVCALLGIELGRFRQRLACPVGGVTVVELAEQGPLLRVLADRSHLPAALRELPGT
jgi:probable phosphoglycerate mutase